MFKTILRFPVDCWKFFCELQFQFKWVLIAVLIKFVVVDLPWWLVFLPQVAIIAFMLLIGAMFMVAALTGAEFNVSKKAS